MSSDEIIRYYDECHGDYKRAWGIEETLSIHYGFHDAQHRHRNAAVENMNRELARRASIRRGEHVVDAGCGIGGSAIWLARHLGVRVTGINIQPRQVEMARRNADREGLSETVRFELADYTKTPLADGSADVVWAIESLCHAPDKRAFVTEARRLLRPGGRLAIADGFACRPASTRKEQRRMQAFLAGWAIPGLTSCDEFLGYLEVAGFQSPRFEDVSTAVMPSAFRLWRASLLSAPLTRYREWTGRRSPHEARNRRAANYQFRTLRAWLWRYWMVTAQLPGGNATPPSSP